MNTTTEDFILPNANFDAKVSSIAEGIACEQCNSPLPTAVLWHLIGPWSDPDLYESAKQGNSHVVNCTTCNNVGASILCPAIFYFEEFQLVVCCVPFNYPDWQRDEIKEQLYFLLRERLSDESILESVSKEAIDHPNDLRSLLALETPIRLLQKELKERCYKRIGKALLPRAKSFVNDLFYVRQELDGSGFSHENIIDHLSVAAVETTAIFLRFCSTELEVLDHFASSEKLMIELLFTLDEIDRTYARRIGKLGDGTTQSEYDSRSEELLHEYDFIGSDLESLSSERLASLMSNALVCGVAEVYSEAGLFVLNKDIENKNNVLVMCSSLALRLSKYRLSQDEGSLASTLIHAGNAFSHCSGLERDSISTALLFFLCFGHLAMSEEMIKQRRYVEYLKSCIASAEFAELLGQEKIVSISVNNAVNIAVNFAMRAELSAIAERWPGLVPAEYLEELPKKEVERPIEIPDDKVQFLDVFIRSIPLGSEPFYELYGMDNYRMSVGNIVASKLPVLEKDLETKCLGNGLFNLQFVGALRFEDISQAISTSLEFRAPRSIFIEVLDFDQESEKFTPVDIRLAYRSGFSPSPDFIEAFKSGYGYLGDQKEIFEHWDWAVGAGHYIWILSEMLRVMVKNPNPVSKDEVVERYRVTASALKVYLRMDSKRLSGDAGGLRFVVEQMETLVSGNNVTHIANQHPLLRADVIDDMARGFETLSIFDKALEYYKRNIIDVLANRHLSMDRHSREQVQNIAARDVRRWARAKIRSKSWPDFVNDMAEYIAYLDLSRAPATTDLVESLVEIDGGEEALEKLGGRDNGRPNGGRVFAYFDFSIIQSFDDFHGFWVAILRENSAINVYRLEWDLPSENLTSLIDGSREGAEGVDFLSIRESLGEWISPLINSVQSNYVAVTSEAYIEALPWNHFTLHGGKNSKLVVNAISQGTLRESLSRQQCQNDMKVGVLLDPNGDLNQARTSMENYFVQSVNEFEVSLYSGLGVGENHFRVCAEDSDIFVYLGHGNISEDGEAELNLSLGRTVFPEKVEGRIAPRSDSARVALIMTCWGTQTNEARRFESWEPNGWPQFFRRLGYSHIISSHLPIDAEIAASFTTSFIRTYGEVRDPFDAFAYAFVSAKAYYGEEVFFESANGLRLIC